MHGRPRGRCRTVQFRWGAHQFGEHVKAHGGPGPRRRHTDHRHPGHRARGRPGKHDHNADHTRTTTARRTRGTAAHTAKPAVAAATESNGIRRPGHWHHGPRCPGSPAGAAYTRRGDEFPPPSVPTVQAAPPDRAGIGISCAEGTFRVAGPPVAPGTNSPTDTPLMWALLAAARRQLGTETGSISLSDGNLLRANTDTTDPTGDAGTTEYCQVFQRCGPVTPSAPTIMASRQPARSRLPHNPSDGRSVRTSGVPGR